MNANVRRILEKVSHNKIKSELDSVKSELDEVLALKTEKQRCEWLKKHPKKAQKIWRAYLNVEIEWSIETLKELQKLVKERCEHEKRACETIISRVPINFGK